MCTVLQKNVDWRINELKTVSYVAVSSRWCRRGLLAIIVVILEHLRKEVDTLDSIGLGIFKGLKTEFFKGIGKVIVKKSIFHCDRQIPTRSSGYFGRGAQGGQSPRLTVFRSRNHHEGMQGYNYI